MQERTRIVDFGPSKGRGLVSTVDVAPGAVLFEERPVVCAQYSWNKMFFPACTHCMRSLETPSEMLRRLAGLHPGSVHLPALGNAAAASSATPVGEILACQRCGDRARFCSEECRREAWGSYHSRLCVGVDGHEKAGVHPVEALEEFWKQQDPPPESSTIMLIARIIAMALSRLDRDPMLTLDHALADIHDFQSGESAVMNDDGQSAASSSSVLHRLFEKDLEQTVETTRRLMMDVFAGDVRANQLLKPTNFRRLLGIMALNGQGVGTSALEDYQRHLRSLLNTAVHAEAEAVLEQIEGLADAVEEVSGDFTNAEGSALYKWHSKINHSCVPNAEIRFPYNSAVLQVVAIQPIRTGDEVYIDYLSASACCDEDHDADADSSDEQNHMHEEDVNAMDEDDHDAVDDDDNEEYEEEPTRRDLLRKYYLFECTCVKCNEECSAR